MNDNFSQDTFTYLVAGVLESIDTNFSYPYSGPFKFALDRLASLMVINGTNFPKSMPELLALFALPLNEWWPGSLPDEIDGRFPLLTDDGEFDEQIEDYLFDSDLKLTFGESFYKIRSVIDQKEISDMVLRARSGSSDLADQYVIARRFLIENPWIGGRFESLPNDLVTFREVVTRSYIKVPKSALHDGVYWLCPYCRGILVWDGNKPRCAKPSICARQSSDYLEMQALKPEPDMLCLKKSIHSRVCLPGIPEIDLYRKLLEKQKYASSKIQKVDLWPDADTYDIRIAFNDGTAWAIDVKDYANPVALAKKITGKQIPNFGHKVFGWSKAFYVIPDYREEYSLGYLAKVREIFSRNKPKNTEVISLSSLLRKLSTKVRAD